MLKRFFMIACAASAVLIGSIALAKHADLAGVWYTPSSAQLRAELEGYLRGAEEIKLEGDLIGVIAPHAGFVYSGPVAAYAYKQVMAKKPEVVIILGFSHRRYFSGKIAVFTDKTFITPLGKAEIDMRLSEKLIAFHEDIMPLPQAFSSENSIEMEVPFAQVAAKDARLVLIAACDQKEEVARLLADALYNALRDEKSFVIVMSTDLSHYLPYKAAVEKDKRTIDALKKFDPDAFYRESLKERHELMCGYGSTYAGMLACKKLGANEFKVLKYANSGDTSGVKDRVVGYLSAAFIKTELSKESRGLVKKEEGEMLNAMQRKELLKIARDTIEHYLETGKRLDVETSDEALKEDMGAFVTLHEDGQLRGCIGNMVARGPLYLAVRDMAIASSTEDPRFPRVRVEELKDIDIEISALSPMRRISDPEKIEMGKHGVMVKMGWRSGVYLPQVADETGWTREEFMNSLCAHKAGIPKDAWKTGKCEIYIFTAEVFGEKDIKGE